MNTDECLNVAVANFILGGVHECLKGFLLVIYQMRTVQTADVIQTLLELDLDNEAQFAMDVWWVSSHLVDTY